MAIDNKKLTLLFAAGVAAVAAGPHYHRTRPPVRCALPERDYQYRRFSQPVRSLSASPVTVATTEPSSLVVGAPPTTKAFQFVDDSLLQVDHCSLSQMSVLLHASGQWSVQMLAGQNPLIPPASSLDAYTSEPASLYTGHLMRNEFHIQVYCHAGSGPQGVSGRQGASGPLGTPVVIPIHLAPTWVQRQQPVRLFETGSDPRIRDYFRWIDRVEIEFAYRQK